MVRISIKEAGGPAICAAIDCVADSELGAALQAITEADGGYKIIVGSTPAKPILFSDYSDHPNQLIVLKNGLKSTAAGRGQIIHGTWVPLKAKLHLRDFSPINQDRAIIELFRQCGAYAHFAKCSVFNPDEFAAALACAAPIWASLPGAGYGQHENKSLDLATSFGRALANYASTAQALGVG